MTLSWSDDRAYLAVEHPSRYALGDPAAPDLTLNTADADGCLWAADVPEGWAFPEVELPMETRPSGHGGYGGEPTLNVRVLAVEGTVTAPTAAALTGAYRRLMAALLGSLPGYVRYTHLDEDPARGLWTQPSGQPKWRALDDRVAEFGFILTAEDPIKTGAADTFGPVRLPSRTSEGGYPLPLLAPSTAGSTSTAQETRRNRVPNPVPASTTSWFGNAGTGGTAATSYVATGGPDGRGYFRATWSVANTTASGASSGASLVVDGRASAAQPIPVSPGQVVSAALYARCSIAQRAATVLRFYDAAGVNVGTFVGAHAVLTAATWAQLPAASGTAPATAAYLRIEAAQQAGTSAAPMPIGGTLDAALAIIEFAATLGPYFDGSTAAWASATYSWSGAVNLSPSIETSIVVVPPAPGSGVLYVMTVPNVGDVAAHAVYTVTGPVPQPVIRLGTGEFIALTADLGVLDTWTVDTAAGISAVNGVNRYDAFGAGSTFPLIPEGGTEVRLRSLSGGSDPAAGLLVTTAPHWK